MNNSSGVALMELYDLDAGSPSDMANLSTRGNVQTTDNVLIGGFIVGQAGPSLILVRALGPSLASDGVSDALADPTLDLRNSDGTLIQSNDNWGDTQGAEIAATGIAPPSAAESGILQVLQPGDYTATVTGKNGGTGVALVEVYNLGEY